ncbi:hypothetical protein ACUXI4_000933 [Pantoea piersonii]|jgi:hypothetical protein
MSQSGMLLSLAGRLAIALGIIVLLALAIAWGIVS